MSTSQESTKNFGTSPRLDAKLREYGIIKKLEAGDIILNDNAYIRSIPIVMSGSIRVMRTDDEGREILLYYIQPGESCIMSFLGGMHQETSKVKAVAEEDTEILFIGIEKVHTLIQEYPEWLEYIFKLYHKRFEELLEVVNAIAFKKLDERLLDFIRRKAELSKNKTLHTTHEQLAMDLGTARVVVSRLLKQMEEQGFVKLGRNKITLL
ncbi:Crp/Fnr family transcriptional regulator [Marinilongibacter aquaticus]|uniref:Crp/Fnr family transcriptional regulator n=1 Tax=Marinilongibacter aquaticus TaxID=2975157 RepID=UPI0021BD005D|nr:Crp/Fnr family transcriptional regulator [Marinilongibacter aquaticus]UBM60584.1 Crp/Fnr family transcriptional regulator [Marinilongibacter aquaticus]